MSVSCPECKTEEVSAAIAIQASGIVMQCTLCLAQLEPVVPVESKIFSNSENHLVDALRKKVAEKKSAYKLQQEVEQPKSAREPSAAPWTLRTDQPTVSPDVSADMHAYKNKLSKAQRELSRKKILLDYKKLQLETQKMQLVKKELELAELKSSVKTTQSSFGLQSVDNTKNARPVLVDTAGADFEAVEEFLYGSALENSYKKPMTSVTPGPVELSLVPSEPKQLHRRNFSRKPKDLV
jgi:transcription elongation factor Elf1